MSDQPETPDAAGGGAADDGERAAATGADAAREALARAKEAAFKAGYRPGQQPRPGDSAARSAYRRRSTAAPAGPEYSGAGPDQRDPQTIGNSLDDLASQQQWNRSLSIGTVLGSWSKVVGDEVAAHTTPEKVEDDQLVVRADSTAWASNLNLMATSIVARLAEVLGDDAITKVRVLGPNAPSWKKGPRSVPGRGPRDTYG